MGQHVAQANLSNDVIALGPGIQGQQHGPLQHGLDMPPGHAVVGLAAYRGHVALLTVEGIRAAGRHQLVLYPEVLFQRAFNMLKAGHPDVAYVYLWDAHYLLLSLLGGILVAVVFGSVSDYLGRQRMRRHFRPPERVEKAAAAGEGPPEQSHAPADKQASE